MGTGLRQESHAVSVLIYLLSVHYGKESSSIVSLFLCMNWKEIELWGHFVKKPGKWEMFTREEKMYQRFFFSSFFLSFVNGLAAD